MRWTTIRTLDLGCALPCALAWGLGIAASLTLLAAGAFAQNPGETINGELPGEPQAHATHVTIDGTAMAAKVLVIIPPEYPKALQDARVGGTVILRAVIARDGTVKEVTPLSGPTELRQTTIEAVRRWRYNPTVVGGRRVEVSTTITVLFTPGQPPRYEQQGAAVPNTAQAIDPQFKTDIMRLIEATHLKETMGEYGRQVMEMLGPSIADSLPATANRKEIIGEVRKKLTSALQSDDATDRLVVVYAKYLSDDDVKGAAAFYETPAGQRFNTISTQMEDDLSQSGEQFAMENLNLILKGLCASHPELRGKTDFCRQNQSRQHSAIRLPGVSGKKPINARVASGN